MKASDYLEENLRLQCLSWCIHYFRVLIEDLKAFLSSKVFGKVHRAFLELMLNFLRGFTLLD